MSQPPTLGQDILIRISTWTRIALDIKSTSCRADDNGLTVTDCIINLKPRRRGTITIHPSGQGLYEIRFKDLRGSTVEHHDAADLDYIARLLRRKAGVK